MINNGKRLYYFVSLQLATLIGFSQSAQQLKIRAFREQNEGRIVNEFVSFLSIPNIAGDQANIQKNASFIMTMMKQRGISNIQLLKPTTSGVPPAVYGEVKVPGAARTIIFYAHYDGQPVDSTKWAQGLHPFRPSLYNGSLQKKGERIDFPSTGKYDPEWRLYARGASDDKGGVMAIINAYDALVNSGFKPTINIKFFFEGEEEAGSDHLYEIFEQHQQLLQSDLWIICDGPVHQSGKKQVVFGVRGDTHLELTVFGSKRPLHSGHYGNWAPNPAMMLAKLLSTMKDENGKVTVDGFYDDVTALTPTEKKALAEVPPPDEQMKNELGFLKPEMPGVSLSEAISLPSLNINGIQSANVGKLSSNIIPTVAIASIDLRLVLGNDWTRQQDKVISHISKQGYFVTEREPTDEDRSKYDKIIMIKRGGGYNAQRTSMDLPVAQSVIAAVKSTVNDGIVLMPSSGGSLPLFVFEKYLNAKTITVPIANHDNNQHAENENIRLLNLWNGIETLAAVMMMK